METSRHALSAWKRRAKSSQHLRSFPWPSTQKGDPHACSPLSVPNAWHLPPSLFATHPVGLVRFGHSWLRRDASCRGTLLLVPLLAHGGGRLSPPGALFPLLRLVSR